ncbi:nucleoporin NUP85 [Podospora aff. communis PSN243]|uniref:Nuclear pore complex protein Nup85 n=1 Tax=Podospora aff. communis PSN243 TaxID=3040156 RepID=A0AAV9GK53_9PEZI|nr:nucleoporin NUP85 [Podospora aff. communis PSN243]
MWLDMPTTTPRHLRGEVGDESDLMMLNTPAATERVRREAEDLFRASSIQAGAARRRDHRAAALAKDIYTQMGTAELTEAPQVILGTEAMINRLYDDGVGEADDEEKLEDTLATVAGRVATLWQGYVDKLPGSDQEHNAEIGPGPQASPFEKANYLAHLALQVHHSRYDDGGLDKPEPLPATLFGWLNEYHNLYAQQIDDVLRHRPSPACHSLFWESIFISLLRGNVNDAMDLLQNAGWGHVKKSQRGEYAYSGQALENVESATADTVAMLETCPGLEANWEIWSSDWTLFRVRAQGALEHLRRFAEGKGNSLGDSFAASTRSRSSMAGLARRAESQVPWEIYENLNIVFDIVLGSQDAIIGAAQDWCEATIGLFGWWDERRPEKNGMAASLSRSQAVVLANGASDVESYLDRLARAFHVTLESDFHYNSSSPLEVGMACVFEDNIKAVIGLLRGWSLPIASAVAEIASLGRWLPSHRRTGAFGFEDLDMDDLEVLGMDPAAPDEVDGIKDSTLVQYAQALAHNEELSSVQDKTGASKDGWELAINVLGRMDSHERSEEMVGLLVRDLLEGLRADSSETVDRIWALLNSLGMIPFAEETAEAYGEILKRDSHRYGEAMWYYALAHRPNKVRDVMNLLISYSLVQSTAYPPTSELDPYLQRLLADRNKTLEECAKQDLEAAELLGKMLSGYASLRQFYDIRDSEILDTAARQQAAAALVSVIASSDDNIRGGLYDQSRDGIVSEDFLLALLGEATAFVTNPDNTNIHHGRPSEPAITLDHIDTMLKALEDLHEVGDRVKSACEEFLQVVLAAAPGGLKGSTPADLLKKSTGNVSGSYVLGGSSVMVSQLQKSLGPGAGPAKNVKRSWDWRKDMAADTKGEDVIRRLRLGLAKDLAGLWLAEADSSIWGA